MPQPNDLLFPKWQREQFKTILTEEISGSTATAGPGRPTACVTPTSGLRLLEGADIYQIAKNCRTSSR